MKKSIIGLTLAASIMLAACSDSQDNVIMTSSVGDLTEKEFYQEIKNLAGEALLEQIVIEKILNEKYEVTAEEIDEQYATFESMYGDSFADILATNGYTEDTFRDYLVFQILQQKAVEDVEISDEEIEAYYNNGKYELHTRHIVVSTEEEAEAVATRIAEGEDFASIVAEVSLDSTTVENGGDLDWLAIGEMDATFAEAAYQLEVNEVSSIVETSSGFEIIQLLEKREVADYASLEEQKDAIIETLKAQKVAQTEWATVEAKLLKEAEVVIKDKDLQGAFSGSLNEE